MAVDSAGILDGDRRLGSEGNGVAIGAIDDKPAGGVLDVIGDQERLRGDERGNTEASFPDAGLRCAGDELGDVEACFGDEGAGGGFEPHVEGVEAEIIRGLDPHGDGFASGGDVDGIRGQGGLAELGWREIVLAVIGQGDGGGGAGGEWGSGQAAVSRSASLCVLEGGFDLPDAGPAMSGNVDGKLIDSRFRSAGNGGEEACEIEKVIAARTGKSEGGIFQRIFGGELDFCGERHGVGGDVDGAWGQGQAFEDGRTGREGRLNGEGGLTFGIIVPHELNTIHGAGGCLKFDATLFGERGGGVSCIVVHADQGHCGEGGAGVDREYGVEVTAEGIGFDPFRAWRRPLPPDR